MGIKKIILLLIILPVIMAGCLDSGNQEQEEESDAGGGGGGSGGNQRSEVMSTPQGASTPAGAITPGIMPTEGMIETPLETETAGQIETETTGQTGTPTETASPGMQNEPVQGLTESLNEQGANSGQSQEISPNPYLVRLKDYDLIPPSLEINTGDTVVWRNYQESTVLYLVSKEGLFEGQRIPYGRTFLYTFSQPGTYNFYVEGYPRMEMTITVK
ncbi:MAG: cell surface lipoprotein [Methanosarcina sp.]